MNRDATNPYARHADDTADFAEFGEIAGPSETVEVSESTVDGLPMDEVPVDELAEVDLDQDPFADGLSERLASSAPRRWRTRTTVVLTSLLILVGGFVGGLEVQKHWGAGGSTAASQTGLGAPGAGFGSGALPSGAPVTGATTGSTTGATTGTVKLVDGDTVYITTSDGRTITVKTSGSTTVQTATGGSLGDLTSGSTVTVQGKTGSDGSISASTITKAK